MKNCTLFVRVPVRFLSSYNIFLWLNYKLTLFVDLQWETEAVTWNAHIVLLYHFKNSSMKLIHILWRESNTNRSSTPWLKEWLNSEQLRGDYWQGSRIKLQHLWLILTCCWRVLTNKCSSHVILLTMPLMKRKNVVQI